MKNYVMSGDRLELTAASAINSGDGVIVGDIFGVASGDIAAGETGIILPFGIYDLTKVGSQAWAEGDIVYWDEANSRCTTVAGTNRRIGVAVEAVGSGADETTGRVRLDGVSADQGPVADFEMSAAAGSTNQTEVTITAKDAAGNTVAMPTAFDLWLSDNDDGGWLTSTSASGAVGAKSGEGQLFTTYAAKKAFRAQSKNDGTFVLQITDTAKTAFRVCAQAPATGRTIVGLTLATGDYG